MGAGAEAGSVSGPEMNDSERRGAQGDDSQSRFVGHAHADAPSKRGAHAQARLSAGLRGGLFSNLRLEPISSSVH